MLTEHIKITYYLLHNWTYFEIEVSVSYPNPVKMSKKPYVFQQGSNNLVIVPTENYEPSPKKVKLDNNNVSENVPVQIQRENVINSVSNQVHSGVSSRNNNVLIDVSKIRRQQNSWATNFMQSIGGTTHKSSRIYNNVATKSTCLPKENNLPNNFPKIEPISQHITQEVHKPIVSRSNTDSSSEYLKANKETRLPEVKVHSYPNKKDLEQLNKKVNDKQTKPGNDHPKETGHLKSAQIKKKVKVDSARISDKQKTPERKKLTHLKSPKKAHVSKTQNIQSPRKANQVVTKLKTNKEIIKSETKKDSHRLKSDKPLSSKNNIVLNLKATKTCEKKNTDCGDGKRSYKESKPVSRELSPPKEFINSKSPIKSVVKKMNYHTEKHYHKADCNQSKAEEISFKEMDADLRSKLKRKNHYHKDEAIRENRIHNNKFSTVPKSKRFVPDENLIISFNANSDSEEEKEKVKEKTPVKTSKTKKQTIGGNKCKKIKLEINITLRHGDATDDESVEEDDKEDQNIFENSDVSFLDDFNIDEIVDSLNDLKNNTEKINSVESSNMENLHSEATRTGVTESKFVDDIESNDAINIKLKRKSESPLHDNNIEKYSALPSSNDSQWYTSFQDSVKNEGNMIDTINESKIKSETIIKEEVSENTDNLDRTVENLCVIKETISDLNTNVKREIENLSECTDSADRLLSNESNIENINSNNEFSRDTVQIDQEETYKSIQLINKLENIVEVIDTKTTELSNNSKNIVLDIKSNTRVEDQGNLSEKEIIDLTNTEDEISQKQVDNDVIIIDPSKSIVTEIDTEPILILDTDYDIPSNSNSDNYENQNTDKKHDTATNIIDESEETISVSKLEAENKNNNGSERKHQNNLVEIKNGVANDIEKDSSIPKNCKKTENDKVPNENMKNQAEVLNKSQSASNNKKSVNKDELTSKIGNGSLIHDTLAHRIEARMESFLGEKHILTSLIHRGHFSTLYSYDDKNGRKSTVKVLHTRHGVSIGRDKENMLKKLQKGVPDHNYTCVRLIDGFSMSGQWCFLMEYYPKTLREVIDNQKAQKRTFHIDDVQRLSAQLVSAVTLLRNNNIIHSDIKPSHILLNDDETNLKLCGFDRAFYYYYQDTIEMLPKDGTVNYRAPELIMGYPADYGIDVWATALVMYEMATTRMLFPGSFNNDILYKQLCTLDNMPPEMHQNSRFRHVHFAGDAFSRIISDGASRRLIYNVYKKDRIHSVLFKGYSIHWAQKRNLNERCKDKAKLVAFSKLLNQMLVMYPKRRIAIEFVFANPFMYGTFE